MNLELTVNAAWGVTLWVTFVAMALLALRRSRAVLRRTVCRLGLVGVPIVLAGVVIMHGRDPSAGLFCWQRDRTAVAAAETSLPTEAAEHARFDVRTDAVMAPRETVKPAPLPAPPRRAEEDDIRISAPAARARTHLPMATIASAGRPADRPAAIPWGTIVPGVALAVSVILAMLLAWRVGRLAMWRRSWAPASDAWVSLTRRLARRMGLRREFSVFIVPELTLPAAAGVFRAAIALPARPANGIGPELRGTLAHELGHLAGRDPLWRLFGRAVAAVAWWCPPLWWLHRRAQVESELTADDHAMGIVARPMDLARTLVRLAGQGHRPTPAALPGMGSYLRRRIEMMIDTRQSHDTRMARPARWLLTAGAALAALVLAAAPLVRVAGAEDRKEGEKPVVKKQKEGQRREETFPAAERIVCKVTAVDGWLVAEGRAKSLVKKLLWIVRLDRVKGRVSPKVRYDGPFVVVTHGKQRFVIDGETGRIIPPGMTKGKYGKLLDFTRKASQGEGRRREGERERQEGEARRREGERQRGEGEARRHEGERQRGERDPHAERKGEGERQRREGEARRREGDRERREGERDPHAERKGERQRREGEARRREGDRERREGERDPHVERKGEGDTPGAELREQILRLRRDLDEARRLLERLERAQAEAERHREE